MASDRIRDHRGQLALVQNDQLMLLQLAARKMRQPLSIIRPSEFIVPKLQACAELGPDEAMKPERLAGEFLVLERVRRRRYIARNEAGSGAATANSAPR